MKTLSLDKTPPPLEFPVVPVHQHVLPMQPHGVVLGQINRDNKKVPKVTFAEFSMGFHNMNYQIGTSRNYS